MSPLRVAILEIYNSGDKVGGGQSSASSVQRALRNHCWFGFCNTPCEDCSHGSIVTAELVTPEEVAQVLTKHRFDAFVVPGGKASEQTGRLGEVGRQAVRSFVSSGGGYVGICAGAFLACALHCPYPSWLSQRQSLSILSARTLQPTAPLSGGSIVVRVQLTEAGREMLWDEGTSHEDEEVAGVVRLRYAGGPLLAHPDEELEGLRGEEVEEEAKAEGEEAGEDDIPAWVLALSAGANGKEDAGGGNEDEAELEPSNESTAPKVEPSGDPELGRFESLAFFAHGEPGEYEGLLGSTAIAKAGYGDGIVIACSPHPEMSRTEAELRKGGEPRLMRLVQRVVAVACGRS